MPVTSTHDPKSEQNARIICITCETPVAQASDLMTCTVCQGARHRGCDWDIEEDMTAPSDGYLCDNCLLNASESTDTNRVENLYRLLDIIPPNETTAQKQEEALEKKESQQIVALKSLVAELEAKIKTVEEENRLLKTRIPAQQVRNEPTTAKTCQDTLTTQLLSTMTSLTETMAALTFRVDALTEKVNLEGQEEVLACQYGSQQTKGKITGRQEMSYEGSNGGEHGVMCDDHGEYDLPDGYLPHSLIFRNKNSQAHKDGTGKWKPSTKGNGQQAQPKDAQNNSEKDDTKTRKRKSSTKGSKKRVLTTKSKYDIRTPQNRVRNIAPKQETR